MTHNCLNLRLIRLPAAAEWPLATGRLSFVFPKVRPGQLVCGLKTHGFSPGDVLVANPTAAGKVRAPTGGELSFWSFSVRLENLYPLFAGQEISRWQTFVEDFKGVKYFAASQPVALECHRRLLEVLPPVDLRHRTKLLHIAAAILASDLNLTRRQRPGFVSPEQHLIQVFESLSRTEILELSMDALAARFGCSRRHLNRLFHQCFGCSVATLRMELRLLKAASRLDHPGAKVIDVATDCGFNHLGVFNVCFKRRFGVTPGRWWKTKAASQDSQRPDVARPGLLCALRADGRCSLPA
jgi:AraC-like DNA-binding protein